MSNLFSELRRRRVFRVAAVYAVAAWAVIQGTGTLVQLLELPAWTGKLVFVLVLIGFPIALLLGWVFDVTADGVQRTTSTLSVPLSLRRSVWFVLSILVASAGAWYAFDRLTVTTNLDANLVAVLPFRVTTADPSLGYLSEGMMDLLGAKLTGQGGPRALDPRAVITAVKRAAVPANELDPESSLQIARSLGAGLLLRGEIVGTPRHVILNAALISSRSGDEKARHSVEGSPDSVSVLVDRLAGQLLARGAGVPEDQISKLAYVPLPAVQSYLAGKIKYRHGEYEAAAALFKRSLAIDSTFVVVMPALVAALEWSNRIQDAIPHVRRLAGQFRDRDSALIALFLPEAFDDDSLVTHPWESFPALSGAAAERALRLAPEYPEVHYVAGDVRLHYGFPYNPTRDLAPVLESFRRTLELDSTFAPVLGHMVEISALTGDTAAVRKYIRRYLAADSAGDLADQTRWVAAHALGDSAEIRRLRARYSSMTENNLHRMLGMAQFASLGLADADLVLQELLTRPAVEWVPFNYAVARGRDDLVQRAIEKAPERWKPAMTITYAMFAGGDTARAKAEIRAAEALVAQPSSPAVTADQRDDRGAGLHYGIGIWRFSRGLPYNISEETRRALRQSGGAAGAALLDAMTATVSGAPDARTKLAAVDSFVYAGWDNFELLLLVAQLHERHGDRDGALKILRSRPMHWVRVGVLTTFLKEEGRLAAQLGDREGAIRAYTHYLKLRSNPSPQFLAERDWVRAQLAKLSADR